MRGNSGLISHEQPLLLQPALYPPPHPRGGGRSVDVRSLQQSAEDFWGKGGVQPPVDEGFEGASTGGIFEGGSVELTPGSPTMDLGGLQTRLTFGEKLRSYAAILGAACTGLGLFYLAGKMTLVRQGELALVRSYTGQCRALGPGWHLVETMGCDVRKASMTEPVVRLGTLTILRVLPGSVGKAQINGQPRLLGPGVHLFNDPLFAFLGTEDASAPKISVADTLHVITVGQEQIGLCLANATGHFLGPGRHGIFHLRFQWVGFRSAREEYMCVGSKHRVLISQGRLGLAWDRGRPLVLEPTADNSARCYNSPTFSFERSVSATQQVIVHGCLKVITVRQGFVGVSFTEGALQVLPPGRTVLESVTHAFAGFLPTGQQTLDLEAVDGMTSDNVGLKFDAAICVQVVDAKKAITMLASTAEGAKSAMGGEVEFDSENIWSSIKARARLALSIIIGNQRLNRGDGTESEDHGPVLTQPGRGGVPNMGVRPDAAEMAAILGASSGGGVGGGGGSAGEGSGRKAGAAPEPSDDPTSASTSSSNPRTVVSFRTRIHDQFMLHFAHRMLEDCGVAVVDMSLEDVRITDPTLAAAMARGAVARADLAKASIERQIKLTVSEAEKASEILKAEGKAQATQIIAAAEALRVKLMDEQFSLLKSPLSQQREALLAAGEVLKGSNTSLVLAASPADAAMLLGGSARGGAGGTGLASLSR